MPESSGFGPGATASLTLILLHGFIMCGIAGFIDPDPEGFTSDLELIALRMASALRHRGPDDEGAWADPVSGVGLGHRRLAVQDLSAAGHQPMFSPDGRFVVIFNGEIYNFIELRGELEERGHRFHGHSDTEVMLAGFSEWGLEPTLRRLTGMFALAAWDRGQRRLCLARDRAGEKPLYYGWTSGVFLFGSELKALRAHPQWQARLDHEALASFIRHNYIPAPRSIYRGIYKLPPGALLILDGEHLRSRANPEPKCYWSLWTAAQRGLASPFPGSEAEAAEQLAYLLADSVKRQMVADVPVGAFLSGGIDSSLIVAFMQAANRRRVRTFSVGFVERGHDEAPYARAVAGHLGTQHTELYVQAAMLPQTVPRLSTIYDEPFADTSHLPTLLLSELARKHVTVCLTGDGGDELFGGYGIYTRAERIGNLLKLIPGPLRSGLGLGLEGVARAGLSLPRWRGGPPHGWERMLRLSELLRAGDDQAVYRFQISSCRHPEQWLAGIPAEPGAEIRNPHWRSLPGLLQRMMFWDFQQYLPDEVLAKVDRASMSVSLETRIPLLDHRIIEFAWSLPVAFRRQRGQSKRILRQLLRRHLPPRLFDRPKQGFAAPVEDWIRGDLRAWAEDLLSDSALRREGLFREKVVRRRWQEHVRRERDWGRPLWNVLMFQAWLMARKSQDPAPRRSLPSKSALATHAPHLVRK